MKCLTYTLLLACLTTHQHILADEQREEAICGAFKEPLLFWVWSFVAPCPNPLQVTQNPNIESSKFKTADGKTLSGYKYSAHTTNGDAVPPRGYILAAVGNAMIADQMIGELKHYAANGFDAYVYDYRGYGNSEGKRRIKAIIEDYKEIISSLNQKYERKMLFGMSFGGVVFLNAIGSGLEFDSAVIDSSPSRLSDHGCPDYVNPINHLSENNASKLLIVTGEQDDVLRPSMTQDLREEASRLGAKTYNGPDFAHPFMDPPEIRTKRKTLIRNHLLMGD